MRPLAFAMQTCMSFPPNSKYYEKEALLMDPVDGPILASLLGKRSGADRIWSFVLGAQDLSLLWCLLAGLWGVLTAWRETERSEEPF